MSVRFAFSALLDRLREENCWDLAGESTCVLSDEAILTNGLKHKSDLSVSNTT